MPISQDRLSEASKLRVGIPRLAASPVQPLQSDPKQLHSLFNRPNSTWAQDVNYLRDIYDEAFQIWEANKFQTPEDQKTLFDGTSPLLNDLLLGLKDVSAQRSGRADLYKAMDRAGHDAEIAQLYAQGGDHTTASIYQAYALTKIHNMLDSLTREGKQRKASFLQKNAYGLDVGGEVQDGVGSGGDQKNLRDTAQPQDGHRTPKPNQNVTIDGDAESDFPELREKKLNRVRFPPRTD